MTTVTGADKNAAVPVCTMDAYALETLQDREPLQRAVRETAPVVWMPQNGIYATGRYEEIRMLLSDWQSFQVGGGIGISNYYKEEPWRPPANPTETDPPHHDAPRRVLSEILGMRTLRHLRESWRQEAEVLVEEALARGPVLDGMKDLAKAYPLKVFPDAIGLPEHDRDNLLAYADLVFSAFGPKNELFQRNAQRLSELSEWVTEICQRHNLSEEGLGMKIWAAVDRGELLPEQAPLMVRSLISAGIDTTIHGIASLLHAFALYPDQWQLLREDPSLARPAFDEMVRWASPFQNVFHTTSRAVTFGGVEIDKHEKILMLLGAANRDPRHWDNPDDFDITRDPSGHLGFGMGIHQCVGQHIARLEAESLLHALVARVERIELAGEPVRGLNNTLAVWKRVPLRMHLAQTTA